MKKGSYTLASAAFVLGMLCLASPAFAQNGAKPAGADLDGCKGQATSADPDGGTLGTVRAPGSVGSSQDDPLIVDWDGAVAYSGSSDEVITNHSWSVSVYGIPVRTGGSENEDEETKTKGSETMSDFLPFRMTGLYYVAGSISGDGGAECSGNMWLKIEGSPIGTVPWLLGMALVAGSIALFMGPVRPSLVPVAAQADKGGMAAVPMKKKRHPISGLLTGMMLGLGASLVMVSHAIAPLGKFTVIATIGVMAAAGIAAGLAGPPRDKGRRKRKKAKLETDKTQGAERRNF